MKPSIYTGFDVIHNLQLPIPLDPPQPKEHGVLIGREWRPTGELPYSRSHPLPTLDYKSLASQQLSYFITRSDCNKQIWEICTCPRRKDGHTKQTELKQLGQVLQNICAANNDLPPIATSQDFHGSHIWILMIFVGLLHNNHFSALPFFQHCTFLKLSHIPFFEYCVLQYKDKGPVFNQGRTISNIIC